MSATARAREETPALDLTALRRMSFKELDALYRAGKRPSGLSDLDGDARDVGVALSGQWSAGVDAAQLWRFDGFPVGR